MGDVFFGSGHKGMGSWTICAFVMAFLGACLGSVDGMKRNKCEDGGEC